MLKTPDFHATHDPIVTKSKGMIKPPEFHAIYDPIVTESKGMLKTPEFQAIYDPIINLPQSGPALQGCTVNVP